MRLIAGFLFFLTMVNFTGIPEIISGLLSNESYFASSQDESDSKENEDSKEEEEKEDLKESLLSEELLIVGSTYGRSLETMNDILSESGYYPEDHSPPPELV